MQKRSLLEIRKGKIEKDTLARIKHLEWTWIYFCPIYRCINRYWLLNHSEIEVKLGLKRWGEVEGDKNFTWGKYFLLLKLVVRYEKEIRGKGKGDEKKHVTLHLFPLFSLLPKILVKISLGLSLLTSPLQIPPKLRGGNFGMGRE